MAERDAQFLQIGLGHVGQDVEIDGVLGKDGRVLPEPDLLEPSRYPVIGTHCRASPIPQAPVAPAVTNAAAATASELVLRVPLVQRSARPVRAAAQTTLNGASIPCDGFGRCDVHHKMVDCVHLPRALRQRRYSFPPCGRRTIPLPQPAAGLSASDHYKGVTKARQAGVWFGGESRPGPSLRYFEPAAGAVHCRKLSSVAFDLGESSSGGALAPRAYRACRSARRAFTRSMPRPITALSSSAEADDSSASFQARMSSSPMPPERSTCAMSSVTASRAGVCGSDDALAGAMPAVLSAAVMRSPKRPMTALSAATSLNGWGAK